MVFLLFLDACNNPGENKNHFPIKAFLQQELSSIDSLPVAVFKIRESNENADTMIVEKKAFRILVMYLLDINLQEKKSQRIYDELILEDAEMGNISISYSTVDEDAAIKKIELNIKTGSNNIKSIFAERQEKQGDTLLIKKILWTTSTEMMVNTCYYKKGELLNNITERYNWTIRN